MRRGLASLRLIFCVAPLLGLFGTMLGMFYSFPSFGSSRSTIMAVVADRLSRAMIPALIGLFVSVIAFWFHQCLNSQLEVFDIEMENAAGDLINRLIVHLRLLPLPATVIVTKVASTVPIEPPRLSIPRIYRHGVLELIWPRVTSSLDAEPILLGGMLVSFAYGILGWLTYMTDWRPISAKIVLALFIAGAVGVRGGSRFAVIGMQVFFALACVRSVIPGGWNLSTTCLAIAPVLLLGSHEAARFLNAKSEMRVRNLWMNCWMAAFIILLPVSIGTLFFALTFDSLTVTDATSVDLSLQPDDVVLALRPELMGAIHRGDIVTTRRWWPEGQLARVAGLPGDRIQIEAGNLIRNGVPIAEIWLRVSSPIEPGADFPIPEDELEPYLRPRRSSSYERDFNRLQPYIVPPDSYFLLNDDRADLSDSRVHGPLYGWEVEGRPMLVYRAHTWPRLLH
jgi:signal peptidase I